MKRRILAFLLALVMIVGMIPTSVFADEAEQETISTPVIETEPAVPQPPEAEAPATEASTTEAPAPEPTQAPETQAPETEAATQAPETEAPEEKPALSLMDEGGAADPAKVSFTVSVKGVLAKTSGGKAAVELPVTVTDADEDGILTYDEALVALHE